MKFKEETGSGTIPFTLLKEPASYIRDQVVNRGIKEYDNWKVTVDNYKTILSQTDQAEIGNINLNNIAFDL